MSGDDELLSISEAAEFSGYHAEWLRELCRLGQLKYRRFGRSYAIYKANLVEYMANAENTGDRRHGPKSDKP